MSGTKTITVLIDDDGNPISHPVIYDINNDERRPVTQEDVDRLLKVEAAFFRVANMVRTSDPRDG